MAADKAPASGPWREMQRLVDCYYYCYHYHYYYYYYNIDDDINIDIDNLNDTSNY